MDIIDDDTQVRGRSASPATQPISAGDLTTRLARLAWRDERIREALRTDPRAVIEAQLGVRVPAGTRIVVHFSSAQELHLALPHNPDAPPPERPAKVECDEDTDCEEDTECHDASECDEYTEGTVDDTDCSECETEDEECKEQRAR
jgi:hypothetical protein